MIFAIVNIEELHGRQLLSLNTYEGDAIKSLKDSLVREFESNAQVITILRELGVTEVWTADFSIAAALLAAGIPVDLKHRLDVIETRKAVDRCAEALIDVLGIEEQAPQPELSAWRKYAIKKLEATLLWLRR